jgi:hypothetical protein
LGNKGGSGKIDFDGKKFPTGYVSNINFNQQKVVLKIHPSF